MLANVFLKKNESSTHLQKTAIYLQNCLELDIDDPAILNTIGLALEKVKNYEGARIALMKGIELASSDGADSIVLWVNLARVLCAAGSYADSLEIYSNIHNSGKGDVWTYLGEGLCQFYLGRLGECMSSMEKSIEFASGQSTATLNTIHLTLGKMIYNMNIPDNIELAKQQFFQW